MTLDQVRDAINRYFGDTSRAASATRDGLCELRDMLDSLIDILPESSDEE